MSNNPTKKQQVRDLINTLRERSHVAEFANGCAKRAKGYASSASVNYSAARYAAANAYAAAAYAADAAYAAAVYAANASASATERDLQIKHLKELHVREENPTKD